ncbi:MAG: class I SAM-dependent methyltransferase [Bacteroidota bacterium]
MKTIKDNFSKQSAGYQKFRPSYPQAVYDEIFRHVSNWLHAWDCGTGNGQVAVVLAEHFSKVSATDISESQLQKATAKENIDYLKCRAAKTPFKDQQFDLITVAQAIHWFDFSAFFQEVRRVGKKGGILAVWGYGLLRIDPAIDALMDNFYRNIIGPYWDAERRHVDEQLSSIPFPFEKIKTDKIFSIGVQWDYFQLEGYLKTWSSVQKYFNDHQQNPVDDLMKKIMNEWEEKEMKKIRFPIFIKLFKIK